MKVGDQVTVVLGPFRMPGTILRVTETQIVVRDDGFFPKRFNRKTRRQAGQWPTPCHFEID